MKFYRPSGANIAISSDQSQIARWAICLIPLLFGLFSMKLGQDYNWDLRNYHLYNAFAFLNGKTELDLAPAQMQSYFNPTIDLLYYSLTRHFPGAFVSFLMGILHGANFVLVFIIARQLLPVEQGPRLPIFLALAGMFGNSFVSQVGNTTGDNFTALAVLGALALMLRCWPLLQRGAGTRNIVIAGALMGIGVGLKLTVAIFALGMCVSILTLPLRAAWRIRAALAFGVGVVAGMSVAGGHWYWKMWSLFGNPFFPQFNNFFHSSLAAPIGVADTRFLPHGLIEYLLWPVIFTLKPIRVSEIGVADPIWLVLYLGSAALLVKNFFFRSTATSSPSVSDASNSLNGRIRLAVAFIVFSFAIWMVLFSIYRYLVPIELLGPLMLWLLARELLPYQMTGKAVVLLLFMVIASNFPRENWGYAQLANSSFRADIPAFPEPSHSIVFTVDYFAPLGWLLTLMPKELPVVGLGSNFPESDGFRQRVTTMARSSSGPLYVIFQKSGSTVEAVYSPESAPRDQELLFSADKVASRYGLVLDRASCKIHAGFVGGHADFFKLCRVHVA